MPSVLHLSPHPDDEAIGAGATLLALRDAGHRIVNVACGLGGREEERDRRRAELGEACRRAGFELVVEPPALEALLDGVELVVSPSPHDGHPAHEATGRAARDAVAAAGVRWWMWGVWADLPHPTLHHGFGEELLAEQLHVLAAYEGELARNDYAALVRARAVANRVLGSERVFGFGSPARPEPYAELLTEVELRGGRWIAGAPRALDPALPPFVPGADISAWLAARP